MMVYFEHITFAMLHNILFLGILWLGFLLIENIFKFKASSLFKIGSSLQIIATLFFIFEIFQWDSYPIQYINQYTLSVSNPPYYLAFAGIVYCVILIYLVGKLIYQIIELNDLKKSIIIDHSLKALLQNSPIQVPQKLIIGYSHSINSPVVFGFLEPIILLPFAVCNQMSAQEIKIILLHELAHIVRNDYLFNYFLSITKIILCFNPFNYLLSRKLSLYREIACDEMVLESQQATPLLYTKILYQLSLFKQQPENELRLAAVKQHGELLTRIQIMNNIKAANKFTFTPIVVFLGLMLILFFGIQPQKQSFVPDRPHFATIPRIVPKITKVYVQNKSINKIEKSLELTQPVPTKTKQNPIVNTHIDKGQMNEDQLAYKELITETKNWIKSRQNPIQFASYDQQMDSVEEDLAERVFISSIIRSYQLKRALLAEKLQFAKDNNEAYDYLFNSKEWAEIKEYEKWAKAYLERHQ